MENLKRKTLALFFTKGISLKDWDKLGNLSREIELYNGLAKSFRDIYFFTYGNKEDLKYQKILTHNIKICPNYWGIPSFLYSILLPFLYRKELKKCDILKTNQMSGSWSAVFAKWVYRKKLIVRCGYEWLSFTKNQKKALWKRTLIYFISKFSYNFADKIFITSNKDKEFIVKELNVNPKKIRVISNYINTKLFRPLSVERKNRIIFIGRLKEEKNLFNLISAVEGLDIKLVLIGSGSLKEKLENFTKNKKVNIEFKGNIDNQKLPEEINKSRIFVLPSLYEGCPKVLLEAMSCGIPCIGTNVDGIKEIIQHKKNGYLCKTDSLSIKKAILEVINDKELQQQVSQKARQTIIKNFSLEKILIKEKNIYEAL